MTEKPAMLAKPSKHAEGTLRTLRRGHAHYGRHGASVAAAQQTRKVQSEAAVTW